jgi:Tripartite tricarboxylate transporter family receptor
MGGQVQVTFAPLPSSIELIRAGKLRPLAVTTATRLEVLPDIPTVGDFSPGYEGSGCQGVGAPKNTPTEIVDKLNGEINAGLADPRMKARLADLGATVFAGSPADFRRHIAAETEEVGQGDPGGQRQARVRPTRRYSIASDTRIMRSQSNETADHRVAATEIGQRNNRHSCRPDRNDLWEGRPVAGGVGSARGTCAPGDRCLP